MLACRSVTGQLLPEPVLPEQLLTGKWDADWVKMPGINEDVYGVFLYRNRFHLPERPDSFIIHLSADSRYRLFINGRMAGFGPAKSDPNHWIFDTYNIAGFLDGGINVIAVMVWNYGAYRPASLVSRDTRFLCQGNGPDEAFLNTPGAWKVIQDESIGPVPIDHGLLKTYIVVPPGDYFTASLHPWGWTERDFDHSGWENPESLADACPRGTGDIIDHALIPRQIPAMKMAHLIGPEIRRIDRDLPEESGMVLNNMVIPPGTRKKILLDHKLLINAFPALTWSGGNGATITVTYSESLFDATGQKGNRNTIVGKTMTGYSDIIKPDGGTNRQYTPLWFRTFRYAELEIETEGDSLVLNRFDLIRTGYPFMESASFQSSHPRLHEIWQTGWRTAELCAGETYYDCPYYEQLQYVGDTRIQSLISLYVSGDDRLMRKAIIDFYHSILPEGLTQSRYPSEPQQIIPTYSLLWIFMLNDYLWHRPDYEFVFGFLIPVQNIISWFEKRIDEDTGMVGPVEFWPFIDWTPEWESTMGAPPEAFTGNSSIVTLLFAMAVGHAAEIFTFFGYEDIGTSYDRLAEKLTSATADRCWNTTRELMADSPSHTNFSQHANALAVLTGAIPEDMQALLIERVLRSKEIVQAGFYFKFYLNRALIKAGLGNKYLEQLHPWFSMIDSGLTTFAEKPDPSRSDCHAWSASPLIELISTVAGIRPGNYGFESVIIEPKPGNLRWIKATMPHYRGVIQTDLEFSKKREASGTITLPPGLTGIFIWNGSVKDLVPGKQKIHLKSLEAEFKIK